MADNPESDPDDEAWEKAKPRLKGIFREGLDEWLNEMASTPAAQVNNPDTPDTEDDEDDDEEEPVVAQRPTAARGGSARTGRAAAAGGSKRTGNGETPARKARQSRPSGGSILDVLIGR